LVEADAARYRLAARRLARMLKLATGSDQAAEVGDPDRAASPDAPPQTRLQQEFDRAGLP
jgi:hypothetical protein